MIHDASNKEQTINNETHNSSANSTIASRNLDEREFHTTQENVQLIDTPEIQPIPVDASSVTTTTTVSGRNVD